MGDKTQTSIEFTPGRAPFFKRSSPTVAPSVPVDTSEQAADSVEHALGRMQAEVMGCIESQGLRGATCDEVEAALDGRHQTISARVYELARRGLIVKADAKRQTRSGRQAQVWLAAACLPGGDEDHVSG